MILTETRKFILIFTVILAGIILGLGLFWLAKSHAEETNRLAIDKIKTEHKASLKAQKEMFEEMLDKQEKVHQSELDEVHKLSNGLIEKQKSMQQQIDKLQKENRKLLNRVTKKSSKGGVRRAGANQWRAIVAKYWPADTVDKVLRIIQCESGGDPTEINPAGPYYGLMQCTAGTGGYSAKQLMDPETNIKAARTKYRPGSRRPWGAWPSCGKRS